MELADLNNSLFCSSKVTGEDGLKALKVCEAAIESASIGEPVLNNFHPLSEMNKELI